MNSAHLNRVLGGTLVVVMLLFVVGIAVSDTVSAGLQVNQVHSWPKKVTEDINNLVMAGLITQVQGDQVIKQLIPNPKITVPLNQLVKNKVITEVQAKYIEQVLGQNE